MLVKEQLAYLLELVVPQLGETPKEMEREKMTMVTVKGRLMVELEMLVVQL